MADSFGELEGFIGSALQAIAPASRAKLFREVARELRKRNQKRIAQQVGPDGEAWEPRKHDRDGNVRSTAKMLQGFRDVRRMRIDANADGAGVGYRNRNALIASVHHYGLTAPVDRNGHKAKYPARPLLGLSDADVDWLRRRLLDHIAEALP